MKNMKPNNLRVGGCLELIGQTLVKPLAKRTKRVSVGFWIVINAN